MHRASAIFTFFLTFSMVTTAPSQPRIIELPQLDSILNVHHDTTYILNFWATWCKPCIRELPYFEKIGEDQRDENVKVYLVSLDFSEQVDSKLTPYLNENNIRQEVLLLDDTDYDRWINKVDPDWQGAIPATLIFNNRSGTRRFVQKELKETELIEIIKPLLK